MKSSAKIQNNLKKMSMCNDEKNAEVRQLVFNQNIRAENWHFMCPLLVPKNN